MSADDERVPPLTAQQLGLCGPLSDDPGVGPDAARHTPPADDDAPTMLALARDHLRAAAAGHYGARLQHAAVTALVHELDTADALREDAARHEIEIDDLAVRSMELSGLLRGMARRATSLRSTGEAEIERARVASRQVAEWRKTELAERTRLRDEIDTLRGEKPHAAAVVDRMREQAGEIHRLRTALDLAWIGQAEAEAKVAAARALAVDLPISEYAADQILAVLDGPADPGLSPAPKDSQTLDGPDAGLCPECGSEPDPTPLVTRPDMVECQHHCGAWVRPDADPAVTSALDWWHRRVREEEARRLASDTAAHGVLAEWSRMHPCGYLAMYPAMDALRRRGGCTPRRAGAD